MVERRGPELDAVFAALAHPARRAIVTRLREGEATVNELAAPFEMSLAAVSKHLRVLEHAGLMVQRRQGRRRQCRLEADRMRLAHEWLRDFEAFWALRLDGLAAHFHPGEA